jgi:fatty-acyl-CoA synthase
MPAARPTSQTFGDLLDEMAAARPQADAVVHGGRRLTYAGLKDRVDRLARALLADGVRHGDRVAVLLPNRTEWIVASLAAAKLGAVTTAISTYSTPRELAWSLAHSGAGVLIATEAFRGNR